MAFKDLFKSSKNYKNNTNNLNKVEPQNPTGVELDSGADKYKKNLSDIAKQFNLTRQKLSASLFRNKIAIQTKIDDIQAQMIQVQQVITQNMEIKNTLLSQQSEQVDAETQSIKRQNSQLNQEIAGLQNEAKEHVEKNRPMGQQLQSLTQKQSGLEKQSADLATQLKEEKDPALIIAHVDKLRTAIEENERERVETNQNIEKLNQTYTHSKAELKQIRQDLMAKQAQLKDNRAKIEQKKKEIEDADNDQNHQLREAESKMAANEQIIAELKEKMAPFQDELDAVQKEINNWLGSDYPVNTLVIDGQKEYLIDMDDIGDNRLSELKRVVGFLIDKGMQKISLYTSQFSLNVNDNFNSWIEALSISQLEVNVYNPLLNLQKQGELAAKFQLRTDAVSDEWDEDHIERTLTFDDGTIQKIHYYDAGQNIADVNYYQNDKLIETRIISPQGQLVERSLFNEDGTQQHDEYYTQSGTEVLDVVYDQNEVVAVKLLNQTGQIMATFENAEQFTTWWLQNHFESKGVFVGFLDNDGYRKLLKTVDNDALTLLNHDMASNINLLYWLNGFEHSQFLTDNYESEVLLAKAADKPIEVGFVDQRNLPYQLGVMG
ncbi:chromosome segregation protein [Secundilactobacillus silagincola]|uniref:Chromosome segregation protein n=1 Tax=Secundilactobacillus silagincola TaxID=1714681 RepID=A0A1Z5J1W8_9LACO|nr:hypothetical protein [Secundilactobacillus silagincola]GAX08044.1 chromosome segregation protein [Secundilactobacillus silagincola]